MNTIGEILEILQHQNKDKIVVWKMISKDDAEEWAGREIGTEEWNRRASKLEGELEDSVVELDFWYDIKESE